jgi:glycosyltransferase involved in cell wall biosynthesis
MKSTGPPTVTVGVPVYNGSATVEAALRSVMAQDFDDLEILVVDNASTDSTGDICRGLAAEDPRVRYVCNDHNIGQNQNFNRVFELAVGAYFRWMGDDDSLEPGYIAACVSPLDDDPSVSVVTTNQRYIAQDGTVHYERYTGPRPTSDDPIQRLDVLLRLLTGSRLSIDPIYSMIRRTALGRTALIQKVRFGDQILACQLALLGRYTHLDRDLASRAWEPLPQGASALRAYTGAGSGPIKGFFMASAQRPIMLWRVWQSIGELPDVTPAVKGKAATVLTAYVGRLLARRARRQVGKIRGRILPAQKCNKT